MPTLHYLTTTDFDFGAVRRLPKHLKRHAIQRPLLCTDAGIRACGLLATVQSHLDAEFAVFDGTPENPTEAAVRAAVSQYQAADCDGVVSIGGGSSMDLAKAVALAVSHTEPLSHYAAVAGGMKKIRATAPHIAVPTTAGTGSEVSVGSVIILDDGRKVTLVSNHLIPRIAICDPELTLGLPPRLTAATGMDAITHCIEAVLASPLDPPAEAVGLDGLRRAMTWIEAAVADGSDRDARWQMMMAATEGALAFIKGLGAVHAMSHAVGRLATLRAHHGTLNAVILPTVLRFNHDYVGDKYSRLREAMQLAPDDDLADTILALNARLGLPANLRDMGVTDGMIPDLVEHALHDLSHQTNPREATAADYERLFSEAMA